MKTAVYPGSFDPVTNGHLDIIERASKLCETLIVAVLVNSEKTCTFSMRQRVEMLQKATAQFANVRVEQFEGLLVDFARQKKAQAVIKGLRMVSDFENELAMAALNKHMADDVETMFFMTENKWSYLSSSMVKEICLLGGDIDDFVPIQVLEDVKAGIARLAKGEYER